MIARTKPQPVAPLPELPSFEGLAPEKRDLLCNSIKDVLSRSQAGLSIAAVRGAVWRIESGRQDAAKRSNVEIKNMLGCDINVSMITDALFALEKGGHVIVDWDKTPAMWRVPRRR